MKAIASGKDLAGDFKSDTFFKKMSKNVLPYAITL